jgi:hypothetical protein
MEADETPKVEGWQVEASKTPIEWTGDLHDDCTATWAGLLLRAEEMRRADWWWAVYDERTGAVLGHSHVAGVRVTTGKKARSAAEDVARRWLGSGETLPNRPLQRT